MKRAFTLLAAVSVSALGHAPAFAADEVIATAPGATAIDAYRGRVVWSVSAAGGGYRLVSYTAGKFEPLPIAPRVEPFDVDLGPDRRGRPIAVYSRCSKAGVAPTFGGGGCDLYAYSFASRRERALSGANSAGDERRPAIWRGRIAFVRAYRRRGRARQLLYWRPRSRSARSRRLARGNPPWAPLPRDLDMRGTRVAVVWSGEYGGGQLRLSRIGAGSRLLLTAPGSGAAAYQYRAFGASIAGGAVYWMLTQSSEPPPLAEIRRRRLRASGEERARLPLDPSTESYAQDGSVAYYVRDEEIHRVDGLRFERAQPLSLR